MSEDLSNCLSLAEEEIQAALRLHPDGLHRGVVNRCYYAFFWTVRGLLLDKNVVAKTHSGVELRFSNLYIKPGLLPVHFKNSLKRLFKARLRASYDLVGEFSEKDVDEFIAQTQEFLIHVRTHFA